LNDHLSVNFYDYVNGWRIKAACDALRTTDLTVVTISEDVGFNAKSTFNASFKKITGQTPRQYRASVTELQATSVK
jgi:AraC-like DNA-binding protein